MGVDNYFGHLLASACTSKRLIVKMNLRSGRVNAFSLIGSLQCEEEEQALASTVYSVAAASSVSSHMRGVALARISQDLPAVETI